MSSLRKWIMRILEIKTYLDFFSVDDHQLKIVERKYRLFFKSTRSIEDAEGGWLSGIYIDLKKHCQPVLLPIQQLILEWGRIYQAPKNAIILGCAGCSIPRFIHLEYPGCHTLGVELKSEFIDVAKKYFDIDSYYNFKIIQYDALKYKEILSTNHEKFDVQIVDVFDGRFIEQQILSEKFLVLLASTASDKSITIFNLFNLSAELQGINLSITGFNHVMHIYNKRRNFLICIKSCCNENEIIEYIEKNYIILFHYRWTGL